LEVISNSTFIAAALYFLTALLAFAASRRNRIDGYAGRSAYRMFWIMTGLLFLFLAANKLIAILPWFTGLSRCIAMEGGLYHERRDLQRPLVLIASGLGGLIALAALYKFRRLWPSCGLAMLAVAGLCVFLVVKTISLHRVDSILYHELLGLKVNGLLELGAIIAVAINAVWLATKRKASAGDAKQRARLGL
jgi:hypothetical protein